MSISVKEMRKQLLCQLGAVLFLVFAGAVYEHFSHGVYSNYMIYAFVFPLVMGVVPYTILLMKDKYPDRVFLNLWNSAVAVFATGSFFRGVLEISGYWNSLVVVYPIAGVVLVIAAAVSVFVKKDSDPAA